MGTFNFTTGNPNNLTAGASASMVDIQGPFVDLRDFINGQLGDSNLSASAAITETKLATGSNGLAKGAFSAYRNTTTGAITAGTPTLVPYDTEEWDISGWFDTTTSRFTPQIPGFYRFSARAALSGVSNGATVSLVLRKNGSSYKSIAAGAIYTLSGAIVWVGVDVAQANGTTDFFDVTILHSAAGASILGGVNTTSFAGELIGRS